VDCETAREAISALIDGEFGGVERSLLEAHMEACPACRAWRDRAHEVTRHARLAPAWSVPPPSARTLAALSARRTRRARLRERALVRAGLVAVALAQVVVTLPVLILGSDHGAPIHVAHEMGSFEVALAVGFIVAAWRPSRAQGMVALVGAAALFLVATAVIDLAGGRTSPADESPHLLAVAGWLLLGRLAMHGPSSGRDGSLSLGAIKRSGARFAGALGAPATAPEDDHRRRQRTAVAEPAGAGVDGRQEPLERAASG